LRSPAAGALWDVCGVAVPLDRPSPSLVVALARFYCVLLEREVPGDGTSLVRADEPTVAPDPEPVLNRGSVNAQTGLREADPHQEDAAPDGACQKGRKMMGKKSVLGVIVLLVLTAMVAAGAISASSTDDDDQQGVNELLGQLLGAHQIVGSWELTVDRGPALPPVKALTTYTRGGSVVGTANAVTRGPSHGTWEHVRGRLYADTHTFFRFDATGAYLGTQRINETVEVGRDGKSYKAVAISHLFDTNGNRVSPAGGLRATITATRIQVERIPDLP
jgi:hypothetical protein